MCVLVSALGWFDCLCCVWLVLLIVGFAACFFLVFGVVLCGFVCFIVLVDFGWAELCFGYVFSLRLGWVWMGVVWASY